MSTGEYDYIHKIHRTYNDLVLFNYITPEEHVISYIDYAIKTIKDQDSVTRNNTFSLSVGNYNRLLKKMVDWNDKKASKIKNYQPITVDVVTILLVGLELQLICCASGGTSFSGDNYKVIGYVDNVKTDSGVVSTVTSFGSEDLSSFKEDGSYCDHCQVSRYRRRAFIIEHKSGKQLIVGSSCVSAFLAIDTSILSCYNSICNFYTNMFRMPKSFSYSISTQHLIEVSCAVHTLYGGYRKTSEHGSNRSIISNYLNGADSEFYPRQAPKELLLDTLNSKENKEKAKEVLSFIEDLDGLDNFTTRLKEVCSQKYYIIEGGAQLQLFTRNVLGIASFAPEMYKRNQAKSKQEDSTVEYITVGEVGKKIHVEGTCIQNSEIDTRYGYLYINVIEFKVPHSKLVSQVVWKTGTRQLDRGEIYTISGKVKEFTEFAGRKQTVLTRCKAHKHE